MSNNHNYSIRPVEERDLNILFAWRNSERIRAFMYTDHLITMDEHLKWFHYIRHGNTGHALIFEDGGRPLGTVNINRINRSDNSCHWGFYVGDSSAPKGSGTALGCLGLRYIFEHLRLDMVTGEAFSFNRASIGLHLKLGFQPAEEPSCKVLKNGSYKEVLRFSLSKGMWESIGDTLLDMYLGVKR